MTYCQCNCGQTTQAGSVYAGQDEAERNRHRAKKQSQTKRRERAREARVTEQQALLGHQGLLALTLTGLLDAALHHSDLTQALSAEIARRSALCDERAVQARIAAETAALARRIADLEINNATLTAALIQATEHSRAVEQQALLADQDALAAQRRLERLQKRQG